MEGVPRYDAEFNAALNYCLGAREWTAAEFCERTRLAPDRPRRIHPSSVSDWKHKRKHPSNSAILVACQTLALPRSYFFHLGEEIEHMRYQEEALARRRRIVEEGDVEAICEAVAGMSSEEALTRLGEVERLIRERRARAGPEPRPATNE